jgi:hypothetical protein
MFKMMKSTGMRHLMIQMARALVFPVLLSILSATTALAAHKPTQASKAGDMAVSANLGVANAFDENFSGLEPVFTGTFEYYSTPRVSWRGLLGFTSFEADSPSDAEVDFTFLNGNVSYNWEGGWVHPFVTGGVGLYSKDASSSLPSDFDGTELGRTRKVDVGMIGDVGAVLQQFVDQDKGNLNPERHQAWIRQLREVSAAKSKQLDVVLHSDAVPIHPARLCKEKPRLGTETGA